MQLLGLKQFCIQKNEYGMLKISKASNLILKLTISKIENLFHFIPFRVNLQKGRKHFNLVYYYEHSVKGHCSCDIIAISKGKSIAD